MDQYDSTVGRCVHLDAVLLAVQRAGSVHVYAVSGLNLNESQHHRIGSGPECNHFREEKGRGKRQL